MMQCLYCLGLIVRWSSSFRLLEGEDFLPLELPDQAEDVLLQHVFGNIVLLKEAGDNLSDCPLAVDEAEKILGHAVQVMHLEGSVGQDLEVAVRPLLQDRFDRNQRA